MNIKAIKLVKQGNGCELGCDKSQINPIKSLNDLVWRYKCKQSPSVPKYAIPIPKLNDSSTNGLTECVRSFLIAKGYYCARINVQGNYSQKLGRFIHSGATRGQSDLNAIVNGQSWQIEIKHGQDKQSEVQKKIQQQVEASGGVYLVVKTFAGFIYDYKTLTKETEEQLWKQI